jgi:hypothetical protein
MSLGQRLGVGLIALVVAGATIWGGLALWFACQSPTRSDLGSPSISSPRRRGANNRPGRPMLAGPKAGALRRAEACARTALSLDDHDAASHEAMGYVCQHQRKFDLAEMHFNRAMSLNPKRRVHRCRPRQLAGSGRQARRGVAGLEAAMQRVLRLGLVRDTLCGYPHALVPKPAARLRSSEVCAWTARSPC